MVDDVHLASLSDECQLMQGSKQCFWEESEYSSCCSSFKALVEVVWVPVWVREELEEVVVSV